MWTQFLLLDNYKKYSTASSTLNLLRFIQKYFSKCYSILRYFQVSLRFWFTRYIEVDIEVYNFSLYISSVHSFCILYYKIENLKALQIFLRFRSDLKKIPHKKFFHQFYVHSLRANESFHIEKLNVIRITWTLPFESRQIFLFAPIFTHYFIEQ